MTTLAAEDPDSWPKFYYINGNRYSPWSGKLEHPMVTMRPGDFAYGVWTALAITLAEPLRKALHEHLYEHGCGCNKGKWCDNPKGHEATGGHSIPGFSHCQIASDLFRLLPPGDQVIIA